MSDTARILAACGDQVIIERTSEEGEVSVQGASLIKNGQTLNVLEEVLCLTRRKDEPDRFDVHVLHKGPARAASPAYRKNYDAIFGKPPADKELLN